MYEWGVYFWQLPDGHLFGDGEGNMLSINSMRGDLSKMAELRAAATHYGQPEGRPWFKAGVKQVSDATYSEQLDRLKEGYIPSTDDLGAHYDAMQGDNSDG